MQVFFSPGDYRAYSSLLHTQACRHGLEVWAYCLMPNHVHLIVVPECEKGLAEPVGETHRRYAVEVNRRRGWTGHLWQERFASVPLGESHLRSAVRYVLRNPVRSGLVERPTEWPYSSARAHTAGAPDRLVDPAPMAQRVLDWDSFLREMEDPDAIETLRLHSRVGRPLGSQAFVDDLERRTGRCLRAQKPGRKSPAE